MPKSLSASLFTWALTSLTFAGAGSLSADDHGKGRGGGHHHHHGGGTNHFLDVSPWGVSYGFQNDNFGFAIGPIGGGAHQPHYAPAYAPDYGPPAVDYGYAPGQPVYSSPPIVSDYGQAHPIASQPVIASSSGPTTSSPVDAPSPSSANFNSGAEPFYRKSLDSFRAGDYAAATRAVDHAIVEDGQSGFLRLYASQCLLANGEFEAAAAALADGLALTDPAEWGQEVKNFRNAYRKNDYVRHMKAAEKFAADKPERSAGNALCAYHYHYLGHPDAARRHLIASRKSAADDPLVKLLESIIPLDPAEDLPAPVSILVPSK
jgi:tetratricopeptide (TPR) repeat protein